MVIDGLKLAADERLALVEKLHAAAAERLDVIHDLEARIAGGTRKAAGE